MTAIARALVKLAPARQLVPLLADPHDRPTTPEEVHSCHRRQTVTTTGACSEYKEAKHTCPTRFNIIVYAQVLHHAFCTCTVACM